jgi:hypothetical protein
MDLHHSLGPDFTAVEEIDSSGETVGLGEGSNDSDLVKEDLGRRPRDSGIVGVDSVNEERSTSGNVVDGVVDNGLDTSALGNDVETVYLVSLVLERQMAVLTRVLLLDLSPLLGSVGSVQVNVGISSLDLSCDIHLQTYRQSMRRSRIAYPCWRQW